MVVILDGILVGSLNKLNVTWKDKENEPQEIPVKVEEPEIKKKQILGRFSSETFRFCAQNGVKGSAKKKRKKTLLVAF